MTTTFYKNFRIETEVNAITGEARSIAYDETNEPIKGTYSSTGNIEDCERKIKIKLDSIN